MVVLFLLVTVLVLPVLAFRSHQAFQQHAAQDHPLDLSPAMVYLQLVIAQVLVTGLALLAWWRAGLRITLTGRVNVGGLLWGAVVVAGFLGLALLVRRVSRDRNPVADALKPRSPTEYALWVGSMVAAAVGEEVVYRGVLFTLFFGWTEQPVIAALGAALVCGLGHFAQGWRGVGFAALMALALQALVACTGGLLVAMLAHLAYDLLVQLLPEDNRVRVPDHRAEAPDHDGGAV